MTQNSQIKNASAKEQGTLVTASQTVQQLDSLAKAVEQQMVSPGWEHTLPKVLDAIDRIEQKRKDWRTHAFLLFFLMIIIFFGGAAFAMLVYVL